MKTFYTYCLLFFLPLLTVGCGPREIEDDMPDSVKLELLDINLERDPDELNGKGRLFSHTTILPGNGIGYHVHAGDSEIYYILHGQGEYSDNGVVTTVAAGDVTFCPAGAGHSLLCTGDAPLEMIALILYA